MTMKSRTVYALVDPRSGMVRYVGATTLPLNVRMRAHRASVRARPGAKADWFRELAAIGLSPTIQALRVVPPGGDWAAAEQAAIAAHGGPGVLLNRALGGESSTGARHSADSRRRHADATHRFFADEEKRRRFGENQRRALARPETREKLRAAALKREREYTPERAAEIKAARIAGQRAAAARRESQTIGKDH